MLSYVWGADVGGTTTRVGVADRGGTVRCVVTAGPGNPHAVGVATSAARIRAAVRTALELADAPLSTPGVIGLAGLTAVDPSDFARRADPVGDESEAPTAGRIRVIADLAVAFASGTPEEEGIIVLAGTGAGAMLVRAGETLDRRNAWGWLLGDEGSAQWIGRAAVRHALDRLEHGEGDDPLTGAVLDRAEATASVHALIRAVYERPPTWLAGLAPLVDAAARDADASAVAVLDAAAGFVVAYARSLAGERPGVPIVLAGSLLGPGGPLGPRVRAGLAGGGHPIADVTDGIAGACWLALSARGRPERATHRRLVQTAALAPRQGLAELS